MSAADDLRACEVVEMALVRHDSGRTILPWQAKPLATSAVAALIAAGWTLTPPSGS